MNDYKYTFKHKNLRDNEAYDKIQEQYKETFKFSNKTWTLSPIFIGMYGMFTKSLLLVWEI